MCHLYLFVKIKNAVYFSFLESFLQRVSKIINNNYVLTLRYSECHFYCQEKGQIFEAEVKMNLQF